MDPNEIAANKAVKLNPVCPGSTEENQHSYSLKSLVDVNFTEEAGPDGAMVRVCPSCKKTLTNTVKVMCTSSPLPPRQLVLILLSDETMRACNMQTLR